MDVRRPPLRNRQVWLVGLLTVICLLWLATTTIGVRSVESWLVEISEESAGDVRPGTRILFDPDGPRPPRAVTEPWYFVGNAWCLLPFVVSIDYAYQKGPLAGQRSRYFFLWLPGKPIPLFQRVDWIS